MSLPAFNSNSHIIDMFISPMSHLVNKCMGRTARLNKLQCQALEAGEAAKIREKSKKEFLDFTSGRLGQRVMMAYMDTHATCIATALHLGFNPSQEDLALIHTLHTAVLTDSWRRLVHDIECSGLTAIFHLIDNLHLDEQQSATCLHFCKVPLDSFKSKSSLPLR